MDDHKYCWILKHLWVKSNAPLPKIVSHYAVVLNPDICFMLKSSGKYLDSAQLRQFQHHSVSLCKMCYVLLFWLFYSLLCGTFFRWHINSRIMIQEEQCAFRLPELTCSCWIAMVTSVSVTQLLTSACFTCHKLICHLWPLAEIYTRGCWAQSLKSWTLTQHCQCCMICVQIESESENYSTWQSYSQQEFPTSCGLTTCCP